MTSKIRGSWAKAAGVVLLFILMQFRVLAGDKDFPEQPNPPRLVNDLAHILSPAEDAQLESKLEDIARSTSTQISIVTIKNIGDYDVADYTLKLFNQWHIGQQSKNNGVLMLVAMDNHKSNITTGSGLEGALPDIICARILRNEVAPSFKNERYYEGLSKGADAIIAATKGEYKADANDKKQDIPLWAVIAIIVVIYFVLWLINKMRGGGGGNYMSGGGFGGFMTGWFLGGGGFGGGRGGWGGGDSGGGGFGGFGGGSSSGGGASGSW